MNFPTNKFSVILADPPWSFKSYSAKGMGRSADNHYPTMSLEEICNLPVGSIAEKDCVLLIWATMPMLPQALTVIERWEFKFKTIAFTWMKQRKNALPMFTEQDDIFMGQGYWTRSNAELCLLATRGKPKRRSKGVPQAILSPRREHSRKPDEIYERIETLLAPSYVELFARTTRKGWVSFGNQVTKFTDPRAAQGGAASDGSPKPQQRRKKP